MNLAYQMQAKRVLVLTYSMIAHETFQSGKLKDKYRSGHFWMTPASFSDGIGVMVLEKDTTQQGISFHVRKVNEASRMIELGQDGQFMVDGPAISDYYPRSMAENDQQLEQLYPSYKEDMKRFYLHQASPRLLENYLATSDLPKDKVPTNAKECGNMVVPCTIDLLANDLQAKRVQTGDSVTFQLAGAGPERGAFIAQVDLKNPF